MTKLSRTAVASVHWVRRAVSVASEGEEVADELYAEVLRFGWCQAVLGHRADERSLIGG